MKSLESERERMRLWRKNNPEKAAEHARRYREKNIEKHRERVRKWQMANPEKMAEHQRNCRARNPGKDALARRTRRAQKQGDGGIHTVTELVKIYWSQNYRCMNPYCFKDLRDTKNTWTILFRYPVAALMTSRIFNGYARPVIALRILKPWKSSAPSSRIG